MTAIAVIGLGCRYPEAASPQELWENVISQRQSFRELPAERLRLEDYYSEDRSAPDKIYSRNAALIDGWAFDRVGFRISGSTFRSTDLTHWLAVDVAARALANAGFETLPGVSRDRVGVIMGNTLTGEFSRSSVMRLRWPYVRRVLGNRLLAEGWEDEAAARFLDEFEPEFKAPFEPQNEDSLAGALSNTIAGRICNLFDFHGGGYTIDGACASSLLAISNGCGLLTTGDLDLALAGGVDLSVDPFELVGFAKTGALAEQRMRVYDRRSSGFWPGEGCGLVVLARYEDAVRWGAPVRAVIRGWGVSSDGRGGLTRPEASGQVLAIRRAYDRAGYGAASVGLFEGHGTGTPVGDAAEIAALHEARGDISAGVTKAALGSIKANIGHTKAAAGAAALIKAVLAVERGVLPPTTGCDDPHEQLAARQASLRILRAPEPWSHDRPLRAGVSAMGFGGINSHITLEGIGATEGAGEPLTPRERRLAATPQDSELFPLCASSSSALATEARRLGLAVRGLSFGELRDLSIKLCREAEHGSVRAAVLAGDPGQLGDRLERLASAIEAGETRATDQRAGYFLGERSLHEAPRIGFLFPGQGATGALDGGALSRRFPAAAAISQQLLRLVPETDTGDTRTAQPVTAACSMAAAEVLDSLGIRAEVALGHSLGELTALQWAGVFSPPQLLSIAIARGRAMWECQSEPGAMADIQGTADGARALASGLDLVIAAFNAPERTVLSGRVAEIELALARSRERGVRAVRMPVSCAFHSELVAPAIEPLARMLDQLELGVPQRTVVSTVTPAPITAETDIRALVARQVTGPVRFTEAVATAMATAPVDLWIEVGPGRMLSRLLGATSVPAIATDAGGDTLVGFLAAVAAAWTFGADVDIAALAEGRVELGSDPLREHSFLSNPCEHGPADEGSALPPIAQPVRGLTPGAAVPDSSSLTSRAPSPAGDVGRDMSADELIRRLISLRAELPIETISGESQLLTDLNLNSITIAEIASEAARELGVLPPLSPESLANATVAELAAVIAESPPDDGSDSAAPPGVAAWVAPFEIGWQPRSPAGGAPTHTRWDVVQPADHPQRELLAGAFGGHGQEAGIVIAPSAERTAATAAWLLSQVRSVLKSGRHQRVLILHAGQAGAVARTMFLEQQDLTVRLIELGIEPTPASLEAVRAEAERGTGYREARLGPELQWSEPTLTRATIGGEPADQARMTCNRTPVLLATGAGKGIGVEAALALAEEYGARVGILGRSDPAHDAELRANLERYDRAGVETVYVRADVADVAQVTGAVRQLEAELGPVSHVLHAAGVNEPKLIADLDERLLHATLATKVDGLTNLAAALAGQAIELVVTFGSIIARTGMRGEAHYGLANEWLRLETDDWSERLPDARMITLEWSVWGGAGMGERLGRVEALARAGVTPIAPEDGVALLLDVVRSGQTPPSLVVSGRFGDTPTLRAAPVQPQLLRFLERLPVFYTSTELVAECELSTAVDRYLLDHSLAGVPLLPAVVGLEAMAQAASMLVSGAVRQIESISLERPITVPPRDERRIRIAALARGGGWVDVVIRSDETGFAAEHFRASFQLVDEPAASAGLEARPEAGDDPEGQPAVPDPAPAAAAELYDRLLFHGSRFRRVTAYRHLSARRCVVDVIADPNAEWFSAYASSTLVLGDFGARDAYIHAAQACIPHRRVLPVSVGRIRVSGGAPAGPVTVTSVQQWATESELSYEVVARDAHGTEIERWSGLVLRAIDRLPEPPMWSLELVRPFIERRFAELVPDAPAIDAAVVNAGGSRADRSLRASAAIAPGARLRHRGDGKPELDNGTAISISHQDPYTLAVAGERSLACDLQEVQPRCRTIWEGMLGIAATGLAERVATEAGEEFDTAATRLWAALECLRKAGRPSGEPLALERIAEDRWVLLRCGMHRVAVGTVSLPEESGPLIVGLLAAKGPA